MGPNRHGVGRGGVDRRRISLEVSRFKPISPINKPKWLVYARALRGVPGEAECGIYDLVTGDLVQDVVSLELASARVSDDLRLGARRGPNGSWLIFPAQGGAMAAQ